MKTRITTMFHCVLLFSIIFFTNIPYDLTYAQEPSYSYCAMTGTGSPASSQLGKIYDIS